MRNLDERVVARYVRRIDANTFRRYSAMELRIPSVGRARLVGHGSTRSGKGAERGGEGSRRKHIAGVARGKLWPAGSWVLG